MTEEEFWGRSPPDNRSEDVLVVTVELWPGGSKAYKKEIASLRIANVSNLADISDYEVELAENGAEHLGIKPMRLWTGVSGHNRKKSVWSLIRSILNKVATELGDRDYEAIHEKPMPSSPGWR